MAKYFCNGKKDFCDNIENCGECQFADGSGVISSEKIDYIFSSVFGDDYDLSRLRELVKADRNGRCVVLPCKLHDKVFFIENGCVKETEVDSFHNWTSGRWKISTHTDRMFDHWKGYEIDFSGIGKTVFLTRKAAEAALKERKKDEF